MKVYVVFNLTLLILKFLKKYLKHIMTLSNFYQKDGLKYFNYFCRPILIKMRQDVFIKITLVD